jgi:hypothetical protein
MSYMPPSKSDIHITPDRVFEIIERNYGYKKDSFFDPCPVNPKFDGLNISWKKLNFINPPYSKPDYENFIYKAIKESHENKISILLLPTKTDQQWFHDLKNWYGNIVWIKGRLKFKNNKWSATQPHFLIKINGTSRVKGYLESKRINQ